MTSTAFNARSKAARGVAEAYFRQDSCIAVALIGSVGRGHPDDYSDIDFIIIWSEPPTDAVRIQAITDAKSSIDVHWRDAGALRRFQRLLRERRGRIGELWPHPAGPGQVLIRERFYVGGLKAGVIGLVLPQILDILADPSADATDNDARALLHRSVRDAAPIFGHDVFDQLRDHAMVFSPSRQASLVALHADLTEPWWLRYALAARKDRLPLRLILDDALTRLFRLLMTLNKSYLPDSRFKWAERRLAELPLLPDGFADRLSVILSADPVEVIRDVEALLLETLALLEQHGVAADYPYLRFRIAYSVPTW